MAGVPRSGSTWIAQQLATYSSFAGYVHEPDNDRMHPTASAIKYRYGLSRYASRDLDEHQVLALALAVRAGAIAYKPLDRSVSRTLMRMFRGSGADRHRALQSPWMDRVLTMVSVSYGRFLLRSIPGSSQPFADRRVVVKTVHSGAVADRLAAELNLDLVVVLRHPLLTIRSLGELGIRDFSYMDRRSPSDRTSCAPAVAELFRDLLLASAAAMLVLRHEAVVTSNGIPSSVIDALGAGTARSGLTLRRPPRSKSAYLTERTEKELARRPEDGYSSEELRFIRETFAESGLEDDLRALSYW